MFKLFKKKQEKVTGQTSDGYHTFDELYFHRGILFSIICNKFKAKAWKSWKHSDGTMYDGMFIVGIDTPEGTYSYHVNKDLWDAYAVKELDKAPEWDGYKPEDICRLYSLLAVQTQKEIVRPNGEHYGKSY